MIESGKSINNWWSTQQSASRYQTQPVSSRPTAVLRPTIRGSTTPPIEPQMAEWRQCGRPGIKRLHARSVPCMQPPRETCSRTQRAGRGELCAVRCGRVMVTVWAVTACPVNSHSARQHMHSSRRNVLPHTLQCRRPCQHRAHAPFAGVPPVCWRAWKLQDSAGSCDDVGLVRQRVVSW